MQTRWARGRNEEVVKKLAFPVTGSPYGRVSVSLRLGYNLYII